eukprot:m.44597 g.44597  ORF g.44597 m.44597 type:complete len:1537 (+) comp10840_c0_seq3:141-4751(+)
MSTRALPKPPSKIAGGSARVATQRRQYHNAAVKFSPKATKAETMRGTAAFEDMMGSGGFDGMGDDIELDVRDVQDADMELVRSLPQRPVDKVSESSQADGVVPLTERLHRDRRDRHFAAVQKLRSDMGSINTEMEAMIESISRRADEKLQEKLDDVADALAPFKSTALLSVQTIQQLRTLKGLIDDETAVCHQVIEALFDSLMEVEHNRTKQMEKALQAGHRLLRTVAFLLPSEIDKLVFATAQEANMAVLSNIKVIADLRSRLTANAVQAQEKAHIEWGRLKDRWQVLKELAHVATALDVIRDFTDYNFAFSEAVRKFHAQSEFLQSKRLGLLRDCEQLVPTNHKGEIENAFQSWRTDVFENQAQLEMECETLCGTVSDLYDERQRQCIAAMSSCRQELLDAEVADEEIVLSLLEQTCGVALDQVMTQATEECVAFTEALQRQVEILGEESRSFVEIVQQLKQAWQEYQMDEQDLVNTVNSKVVAGHNELTNRQEQAEAALSAKIDLLRQAGTKEALASLKRAVKVLLLQSRKVIGECRDSSKASLLSHPGKVTAALKIHDRTVQSILGVVGLENTPMRRRLHAIDESHQGTSRSASVSRANHMVHTTKCDYRMKKRRWHPTKIGARVQAMSPVPGRRRPPVIAEASTGPPASPTRNVTLMEATVSAFVDSEVPLRQVHSHTTVVSGAREAIGEEASSSRRMSARHSIVLSVASPASATSRTTFRESATFAKSPSGSPRTSPRSSEVHTLPSLAPQSPGHSPQHSPIHSPRPQSPNSVPQTSSLHQIVQRSAVEGLGPAQRVLKESEAATTIELSRSFPALLQVDAVQLDCDQMCRELVYKLEMSEKTALSLWRSLCVAWLEFSHYATSEQTRLAEQLLDEKHREIDMEADTALAVHDTRLARIEEDVHNVRAAELLMHKHRISKHVQAMEIELAREQERAAHALEAAQAYCHGFTEQLELFRVELGSKNTIDQLSNHKSKVEDELNSFRTQLRADLLLYRRSLESCLSELRNSNAQFRSSFKTFGEQGNFSSEEITQYQSIVQDVFSKIDSVEESILTDFEGIESKFMTLATDMVEVFHQSFAVHFRDVMLIEATQRLVSGFKVKIQSEINSIDLTFVQLEKEHERLKAISTDGVTSADVIFESIQKLGEGQGKLAQCLNCIKSGAPLAIPEQLDSKQRRRSVVGGKTEPKKRRKPASKNTVPVPLRGMRLLWEDWPLGKPNTFIHRINEAKVACRKGILDTAVPYYEKGFAKMSSRPSQLKETIQLFMDMVQLQLNQLYDQVWVYYEKAVQKLMQSVVNTNSVFIDATLSIFERITAKHTAAHMARMQTLFGDAFAARFEQWATEFTTHKKQMKPRLAHPNFSQEFNALVASEESRVSAMQQFLDQTKDEANTIDDQVLDEYVLEMNGMVHKLVGIFERVMVHAEMYMPLKDLYAPPEASAPRDKARFPLIVSGMVLGASHRRVRSAHGVGMLATSLHVEAIEARNQNVDTAREYMEGAVEKRDAVCEEQVRALEQQIVAWNSMVESTKQLVS